MDKDTKKRSNQSKKKVRTKSKAPKEDTPKEEGTKWQEFLRRHSPAQKEE